MSPQARFVSSRNSLPPGEEQVPRYLLDILLDILKGNSGGESRSDP
jgi:hypothetical protein